MSLEINKFELLSDSTQEEVAKLVSEYTNGVLGEKPQMLPVSEQDIFNKYTGFVALDSSVFAGYIGATWPEEHNQEYMPEVGSLWVPKEFRGQGLAGKLLGIVGVNLSSVGDLPYAFCNPLSLPVFIGAGYKKAKTNEVPVTAFDTCVKCPAKPLDGCCDTVVILKGNK